MGSGLKLRNYDLINFAGGGCYVENNLQTVVCNALHVEAGAVASVQVFATVRDSGELTAVLEIQTSMQKYQKEIQLQSSVEPNSVTVQVFQNPLLETGHFILEALVDVKETRTFTLTFQIPLGVSVEDDCVGPCSYEKVVSPNEIDVWSYYEHLVAVPGNHEIGFSWTDGKSSGDQKIHVQRLFGTWIPLINR